MLELFNRAQRSQEKQQRQADELERANARITALEHMIASLMDQVQELKNHIGGAPRGP